MKFTIVMALMTLAGCSGDRGGGAPAGPVALEDQLARLDQLGVHLRPGVTKEDLLQFYTRSEYEANPFVFLLVAMGGEVQKEPFPRISDQVWHFDTECIEDDGAYVAIAERVRDLAGGKLAISDLKDRVDFDAGTAWLAFSVGNRQYEWDLELNDDWVDPEVFVKFDGVFAEHTSGLRLIYYDLGGQDCLILMGDSKRLEQLRGGTGLDLVWMNEKIGI